MKKLLIFTLFSFLFLFGNANAMSQFSLLAHQANSSILQVAITIDPTDDKINAIEASFDIPQNLKFDGYNDKDSIVTSWVEKPNMDGSTLSFSGVIVGGWDGNIDPLENAMKKQGSIVTLNFKVKNSESATITPNYINSFLNDGQGTMDTSNFSSLKLVDLQPTSEKKIFLNLTLPYLEFVLFIILLLTFAYLLKKKYN